IYILSLFGSHNDREAVRRSGWKRDINHQHRAIGQLERELADQSKESAQVFSRYARLIALRREQPAFHPSASQRILTVHPQVFAIQRGPREGQTVLALHNVSGDVQACDWTRIGVAGRYSWVDVISGRHFTAEQRLALDPYEVVWLQPD